MLLLYVYQNLIMFCFCVNIPRKDKFMLLQISNYISVCYISLNFQSFFSEKMERSNPEQFQTCSKETCEFCVSAI